MEKMSSSELKFSDASGITREEISDNLAIALADRDINEQPNGADFWETVDKGSDILFENVACSALSKQFKVE